MGRLESWARGLLSVKSPYRYATEENVTFVVSQLQSLASAVVIVGSLILGRSAASPVSVYGYAAPSPRAYYKAAPDGYAAADTGRPPRAYHHQRPAADEYADAATPPKYNFAYDVSDAHTGDYKTQTEERDGDFVKGQYTLLEPDGTKRVVDYTADGQNGFNAVVSKEGHPSAAGPAHHQYRPAAAHYKPAAAAAYRPAPPAVTYRPAPPAYHSAPVAAAYRPAPAVALAPAYRPAPAAAPAYRPAAAAAYRQQRWHNAYPTTAAPTYQTVSAYPTVGPTYPTAPLYKSAHKQPSYYRSSY